jgi:glycosyltransferase involved in cell wall biosynthesis
MKLKIGILGTRGIPNNYGGFEQFAQHISVALFMRGYEVYVYNSSNHSYKEKEWNGVKIIHCKDWEDKMGTAGQFLYDRNCINDARKRNFDILLHLGYTSDSIWHRRWPKKTVNIVNMDGLEWKRTKYNWITRKFLKRAESLAVRHAHTMIADSTAIQEYLFGTYKTMPVYIPYSATPFLDSDLALLARYDLIPHKYFLVIARVEPENNIEMVIQGYLNSTHQYSLLIIGNTDNQFGKYLSKKYNNPKIKFIGALYDKILLDNLRFFSSIYFHGHSVGGTNPSLLEAMACGCNIAAHSNIFNRTVLQNEADYFSTADDVSAIINKPEDPILITQHKALNIEKIRDVYNPEKIINAYESLIRSACQ